MYSHDAEIASSTNTLPGVTYHYFEADHVHEIIIQRTDREVIGELFRLVNQIYTDQQPNIPSRVILVQEDRVIPMNYFIGELHGFMTKYPMIDGRVPAYFAIVTDKSPIIQLIESMLKLMRVNHTVQFFPKHSYAAGYAWLLTQGH